MSTATRTATRTAAFATAATVALTCPIATVGASAPAEGAQHCVVDATSAASATGAVDPSLVCYPTLSEALAAANSVTEDSSALSRLDSALSAPVALSSVVLATHFDASGRSAGWGSLTVTGSSCDLTYNLPAAWLNRISSTQNYCGTVRFFDGYDKSGANETTTVSTVNLGARDNGSYSVYYGT